jgi:hypothetical protein
MADESLGHIDLRMVTSGLTGGAVGGGAAGGGGQNTVSAITQAMSKMSSALDVIRMGTRGAGVGEIASSGLGMAAGAGAGGAALAGVAIGMGVVAAAALAIKAGVSAIQGRISELARVDAGMAQQEALNQIADIRRDMAEARVLGPLYARVSEIMRALKDAIQPFLVLFKGLFTAIIIPILNGLVVRLNELAKYIPQVLKFIITIFQTIAFTANLFSVFVAGLAQSFTNLSGPLTGFSQGLSNIGFNMITIVGALGQILNSLNQQQQSQNPNQWAINTLNALSSGGTLTPALVPAGPTAPGYNPTKPKVTP